MKFYFPQWSAERDVHDFLSLSWDGWMNEGMTDGESIKLVFAFLAYKWMSKLQEGRY